MNILILNGSPKEDKISVTMQYVKYLEKKNKDCKFITLNIGKEISAIQKDKNKFDSILDEISKADGIIWSTPIYVLLVPSQLKKFIEMIFDSERKEVFKNKYITSITTSVHFFDHTAHNYLRGISEDLGMKYVDGLSVSMRDLETPSGRETLENFGRLFFKQIEDKKPVERVFYPVNYSIPEYKPGEIKEVEKTGNKKIVLIRESETENENLKKMIDVFIKTLPNPVEILDISSINIKGGCLGCCECAYDNQCVYKDEFVENFKKYVFNVDILVNTGVIKDRYLSSKMKMFMDRSFFNGHRPILMGKHCVYIISGPLAQLSNLREIFEGHVEAGRENFMGIVTDENQNSDEITALLKNLGEKVIWASENNYQKPFSFLGVGGHLIFRDLVYAYGDFFKSDMDFYKKHNLLDYPQSDIKGRMEKVAMGVMVKVPNIREAVYREAKYKMVEPLQKIVDES
jgi:multimeric flavodoxin WrbA